MNILLAIRCSTSSARVTWRKPREEEWHLDSVQAVLVRPWEVRVRTEVTRQLSDRSTPRVKRCGNTDEHRFAQDAPWVQEHIHPSVELDSQPFGPKSLLRQKLHVMLMMEYQWTRCERM